MKIYIDFDDVICETAKHFTVLAKQLFGVDVPYSEVQFFNLQKSFDINEAQYEELMRVGHFPENLLAYEETVGATSYIQKWKAAGHEISVITGRPYEAYEPSRQWLDAHGLSEIPMYCVDKYGREAFNKDSSYSMTLAELYEKTFDFVIEDSPAAFEHVLHLGECTVAVLERPWNVQAELPGKNFVRCADWQAIDRLFAELQED